MTRIIDAHDVIIGEVKYYEFAGTSLDAKPSEGVATGSIYIEVDTAGVYVYNEDSGGWIAWDSGSSSNTSGGLVDVDPGTIGGGGDSGK